MTSKLEIDELGNKRWYNEKREFHHEEGPAIEYYDGTKIWCFNGNLHRKGGPAWIDRSGTKLWYFNGQLHRDDGPALIRADDTKEWWINGKQIECQSQEEFERIIELLAFE